MRVLTGDIAQVLYFVAVDSSDLITRETGLSSFTVYRSRGGGAATVMTTPTITELSAANMPGVYKLLLDEDMTITAGKQTEEMVFHITQASMAPVSITIELYKPVGLIRKMQAANGSVSSVTLDGSGTPTEGAEGNFVLVVDGAGAGQSAIIADYDNGTKVANFVDNVGIALSSTSIIEIYSSPIAPSVETIQAGLATATALATAQTALDALNAVDTVYKKNTAVVKFLFGMRLVDGNKATGKSPAILMSRDGAAFAAPTDTATEVAQGFYEVDLSAAEMNGDEIAFIAEAAGCLPTMFKFRTQS